MIGMLRGSKSHEPQKDRKDRKDRKDKDHNRFHLTDAPDIALGAINGSPPFLQPLGSSQFDGFKRP